MNILTLDAMPSALGDKYAEDMREFPRQFSKLIPRPPAENQVTEVNTAVKLLTGCGGSADFLELMSRWDFTQLNIAGFSFGFRGTFAERLVEQNGVDAANAWWEDAFEVRPPTQLFIAQGDPYVLVLDVKSDVVLAYIASDGAQSATKIASSLSICLRMLATIQVHKPSTHGGPLAINEIMAALGHGCAEQFWSEQLRHWAQFN